MMEIGFRISRALAARSRVAASLLMAVALTVGFCLAARADERLFGYVLSTDTMPQGRWEQQDWLTARLGKAHGDYQLYQLANGIDYGLTAALQLGLFLNTHVVTAARDSLAGRTSGPFVPKNVDPSVRYTAARVDSGSIALKYRLSSPYKDALGLALAVEVTPGPDEVSADYRAIVHKTFLDDTVILAANIALIQDWQHLAASAVNADAPALPGNPAGWSRMSFVEVTTGLSARFMENWFSGVEFRNSNAFNGAWLQQAGGSAFFLGPNLHYGGEQFWLTFTALTQLPVARADAAPEAAVHADGRLYGDLYERLELRLGLGIQF